MSEQPCNLSHFITKTRRARNRERPRERAGSENGVRARLVLLQGAVEEGDLVGHEAAALVVERALLAHLGTYYFLSAPTDVSIVFPIVHFRVCNIYFLAFFSVLYIT